jgi:hypothetical protein
MPVAAYPGGLSLADLIRDLYRLYQSLAEVQNELARQIISGEIVLLQELAQGWYLEWASIHEEGDGWARSSRKIMIVVDGKQRDPAEFRYHSPLSEPQPPAPSEPAVEKEPPQPDANPPSIATEDPPTNDDAALLPSGRWHILAVVLEGWRRGGLSTPLMQEYFARLVENGAIKLSEALPEGWMMSSQRFGGRVTGKTHFSFIAPGGKELWADEIGCQLGDPRVLDPRLLHLFLASPARVKAPLEPPADLHPSKPAPLAQRRKKVVAGITAWLLDKRDLETVARDHYWEAAKAEAKERFGEKLSKRAYHEALQDTGRTKFGPRPQAAPQPPAKK